MYEAKIQTDSISPDNIRLTTFVITFPRFVLAEFNTHRMFSRNSASSRAIPVEKRIKMILEDPFIPEQFGKNQKGMQADTELDADQAAKARSEWIAAMQNAATSAKIFADLGVHKQLANRIIEPFCWHTVVVTATEWDNFFNLRCHKNAQPEIRKIAEMMRELYVAGKPNQIGYDGWHLPFMFKNETLVGDNSLTIEDAKMVSAGRCARVSYLTHDGRRDISEDIRLAQMLMGNGHMSPFEHIARPFFEIPGCPDMDHGFCGNFRGWVQMRKEITNEAVWIEANA